MNRLVAPRRQPESRKAPVGAVASPAQPASREPIRPAAVIRNAPHEAATDGIFLLDGQTGRVIGVDPRMTALLDCKGDELLGRAFWELGLFPNEHEGRRVLRQLQDKKFIHRPRLPQMSKAGSQWDAELLCNAYLARGKCLMQCHARDISGVVRGEHPLRGNEDRSLSEILSQGVWVADREGILLYVNPYWRERSGIILEFGQSPRWVDQVHTDERVQAWENWQRTVAANAAYEAELRLHHALDGQYRRCLLRCVPLRDEDGRFENWLAVITDIDRRKEVRRKEAESALAKLAAIVQSSRDAIIGLDLVGSITSWNSGAERLYGYGPQEVLNKSVSLLIPPQYDDEEPAILARCCRGEEIPSFETVRKCKDGRLLDVALTISPIKDASGRVIGASKVAHDISDRKRAERQTGEFLAREQDLRIQAEAANRTKDAFLTTLSHELRTPMNAILGWLQTLAVGKTDSHTVRRALRAIEQSAKAQARLIEDLLNVSDIVAGRLRVDVKPISLSAVIGDAIESVRPAIAAKDIYFACQFDSAADRVIGDPGRIQQIVWNLLSNAVKFTPRGGEIRLATSQRNAHAEITVGDNGEGISAEFLPYVFNRFRQADSSTKRKHGGLGLGLAIVRHLTELHGGSVEVDSAGPGAGARFTVRLPLRAATPARQQMEYASSAAPAATTRAATTLARLDGLRILSVDDDDNTREMLQEALEHMGAEVVSAASAAEALTALEHCRPDVLISDIGLPTQDGYDLLRSVRALPREAGGATPAVALSGYAGEQERVATERAGFQAFASKPIVLSELIATIIRLTADKR